MIVKEKEVDHKLKLVDNTLNVLDQRTIIFHEKLTASQIQGGPVDNQRLLTSSTKIADDLEDNNYDVGEAQDFLQVAEVDSEEAISERSFKNESNENLLQTDPRSDDANDS